MTPDLVEKCAINAAKADGFDWVDLSEMCKDDYRSIASAVIDALADGVSNEMMYAAAKTLLVDPSRLSPGGVDDLRRALVAAIRAAKSREG